MNKKWIVTEKIIACLIMLWGIYTLYSVSSTVYGLVSTGFIASGNTSYLDVVKGNHLNIIISIASIYGGTLLLFNEKAGWLLSLICSSIFALSLFMSAATNRNDIKQKDAFFYQSYSLTGIAFLVIIVLLLQKYFREKYNPTAKNRKMVGLVLLVLIIDKILF